MLFSVIYEITEVFLFLSRLTKNGLYSQGVTVNISLHNLKDRSLWLEDNNRIPFLYPRKILVNDIKFSEKYSKDDVLKRSMTPAIGEFFRIEFPNDWLDSEKYDFNWNELKKGQNRFEKINYNIL